MSRIAFIGPFGVGKTTAVKALSEIPVISTEAPNAGVELLGNPPFKTSTTVALDYGEWSSPDGRRVALVGTPGQDRFSTMRSSLVSASTGAVLWIFGNRGSAPRELAEWMERHAMEGGRSRLVVAATRLQPEHVVEMLDRLATVAEARQPGAVVMNVDPRRASDVAAVVVEALAQPLEQEQL